MHIQYAYVPQTLKHDNIRMVVMILAFILGIISFFIIFAGGYLLYKWVYKDCQKLYEGEN